jgi:hypothetical protein
MCACGGRAAKLKGIPMATFTQALAVQRWDDHRFYHHSRINQSLHLLSAITFVVSYVLLLTSPAIAVLGAWLVAMVSRQAGHFFFEPKGFDEANQVTHEYKEAVKVGYNLRRKVVLMAVWAASPLLLAWDETLFGVLPAPTSAYAWLSNLAVLWLAIGAGALLFRTVQLFFVRDVQTGLVWFTKIVTDPFNDIRLYHRAPLHLLRGERIDPSIGHARS